MPSATGARELHTCAPVLQSIVPISQPSVDAQAVPWAHALQVPALHTPPKQGLPLGSSVSAEQTGAPVAQEIFPVRQPSLELQL